MRDRAATAVNAALGLAAALSLGLVGCSGLRLHLVNASVQPPSNVAMYFTVADSHGEPLGGLTADRFNIYEDGRLISTYESKQTILNPEVAVMRYTLLLLDMSGSVVESGQVPLVQSAVSAFASNVGEQEQLAIYAFDGRAEIQPILEFEAGRAQVAARVGRFAAWRTEDPSTNLYGAIVEAARVLEEARGASEVPLQFGTLVVFTDGTDRAHRATSSQALSAVSNADVQIFVIGLGGEVDEEELQRLGRDGYVHVEQGEAVVEAFQGVASRIQALANSYYLLSYCSPSRAASHRLEIEGVMGEERGRLSYRFDAEGFEPDCDPNTPPAFEVSGMTGARRVRRRTPPAGQPTGTSSGAEMTFTSDETTPTQ